MYLTGFALHTYPSLDFLTFSFVAFLSGVEESVPAGPGSCDQTEAVDNTPARPACEQS